MADAEYHVASFVVSTHAGEAARVAGTINSMPGLEVHAAEKGKLIVTAEAGGVRELAELARGLESVEAVIAVAPVYHEYAGEDELAASVSREKER